MNDEPLLAIGGAIKALGDGKVGGYLVRFTSADAPDLTGDYFDPMTDFDADDGDKVTVYYNHGLDGTLKHRKLGKGTLRFDDVGVWVEAQLAMRDEYERAIYGMAEAGKLGWSSGTLPNLVERVDEGKAARITHWPLGKDASLTPTPAAGLVATQVLPLKAWLAQSLEGDGDAPDYGDMQADTEVITETDAEPIPEAAAAAVDVEAKAVPVDDTEAVETDTDVAGDVPAEDVETMSEQTIADLSAQLAEIKAALAQPVNPPVPVAAPAVTQFADIAKYDNLEIADLATLAAIGKATKMSGKSEGPSIELLRALTVRLGESDEGKQPEYGAAKSALKSAQVRVHGGSAVKANELNYSTYSSYGDEWIGVTYSNSLWDKIRLATPVVGRIPTVMVPQGSESVVIPLLGSSPTFYKVAQATAQDANPGRTTATYTTSKLATGQQTLTVSKLGAAVNWSSELDEDSFIPWVTELRRDLTNEAAEILEHIVIDGDTVTTATTNINDIGGTPAGTEAFLVANGFRKLALVTNTANSRSAGTLAVEDYLETLKLMGLAGKNAADRNAVSFITDMHTAWKSLELTEVKTRDVFSAPTIENGVLVGIYGRDVIASPNMHRANLDATYGLKANTSGKTDLDTASNNSTGSILAVRWDQWRFGYKRLMNFEIQREPLSDSTLIVVNMRVGLIYRDTEASAISYNVTL